jgi:hypothetical protein
MEYDFIDDFVKFVSDIAEPDMDMTALSTYEKEVILSKPLAQNSISIKW